MPENQPTSAMTADALRQAAADDGLPYAIEEAKGLVVGAVGFMIAQAGQDRAADFMREVLASFPKH